MSKRMWVVEWKHPGMAKWRVLEDCRDEAHAKERKAHYMGHVLQETAKKHGLPVQRYRVREWKRVKEKAVPKMAPEEAAKVLLEASRQCMENMQFAAQANTVKGDGISTEKVRCCVDGAGVLGCRNPAAGSRYKGYICFNLCETHLAEWDSH